MIVLNYRNKNSKVNIFCQKAMFIILFFKFDFEIYVIKICQILYHSFDNIQIINSNIF